MHKILASLTVGLLLLATQHAGAAITLAPMTSFGGGDGWLAPGEGGYSFLGTGNNERGLAYGNGHLYLVSRTGGNNVRILNENTGADLGGLSVTGITGGTFAVNTAAVGGDGKIYVNNMTTNSTTSPFKVYSWTTEASAPAVAYSGDAGLAGARVGDSLAGFGSGSGTRLAAGYGSTPAVTGNNGYAILDPTASTATRPAFSGSPPSAGDFRLGLTFSSATNVIGAQGSSIYRYTSFAGSSATLLASPTIPDPVGATADRLLAYTDFMGQAILAVQSIGDSHVSIYDVTNPATPIWIASANNTLGALTANTNATGQIAWGATTDNGDGTFSRALYTMSTNQGIQAFKVTLQAVPEASAFLALGLVGLVAGGAALARRKTT